MQAIILAAGMGRRLGEFTANNTKCMLEVNGVRLIDRMLNQLAKLHLKRIVIVVGYKGENLKNYLMQNHSSLPIVFVENNVYDKTNNIYSLWLARELMAEDDTLLLESDLIYEDAILEAAFNTPLKDVALVSKYEPWMDGTMVRIDDENNIVNFISRKAFKYTETDYYYKTVNIYKFSCGFVVNHYIPFLEAYIKVLGENEYYEQVLRVLTLIDSTGIKALPVTGKYWYEIDDVQDLRIAETMFAQPKDRLAKLQQSSGGYWRYPGLHDFCYLANPYFPRQRMIDELKANFEPILRNHPSGMSVNSLLAGKYFGLRQKYIVVGNGTEELIKSLIVDHKGHLGMTFPASEEYSYLYDASKMTIFQPDNAYFSYTVDDLMSYFADRDLSLLLIVNPDNPSGNFIPHDDLGRLAVWAQKKKIRLVIDASFADFSDNGMDEALLQNEFLERFPTLCVLKSISNSCGVPGLRLGVLASADEALIARKKKDVSMWNIDSFAEFYMQIYSKYEKDYVRSCEKFRQERTIFERELKRIPFLRVIPSQANYFLCEVKPPYTSYDLTLRLLTDYNILIKDFSVKKAFGNRQYVRIAIRDRGGNRQLVEALHTLKSKSV